MLFSFFFFFSPFEIHLFNLQCNPSLPTMCHQWIGRFIHALCYTPSAVSQGSYKVYAGILQICLRHFIAASSISSPIYIYIYIRRDGQIHLKLSLGEFNDYRWESCNHHVLCGVCASIYTSLCRWSGLFSHTLAMIHLHTEPTHSPYQLQSIWHYLPLYLMLTLMLRRDIPGIQKRITFFQFLFLYSLLSVRYCVPRTLSYINF